MLITDPFFYTLAVPAFLLTGISKGGFASGAGNTGVPLMSVAIPAPDAAGIALPVLCAMDISAVRAWWGRWDRELLLSLLPGVVVGMALGTLVFGMLSDRAVKLVIGVMTLAFLARSLFASGEAPARMRSRVRAFFSSAASGVTSFIAHAGGPPLAIYLFPLRLPRQTLAATTAVFFAFVNYAKLVPYGFLGVLSVQNLLTSLVLLPLAPIGIKIGVVLAQRMSDRIFYRVVHVLLFLTSLHLIWEGGFR
ncbi:sulfite exporter TauE/SafE family protein [Sabulicella rubraurantiaca]|uniref:sulfite exporter TauE/SafE family protein n=1 Tax=Sabulicella rubraurantiaca TaxID=2811429 RepID=UPI001A965E5E|nr:sulfite exporter TauE/SafE family protein [Sabulicella rubraurantiaca]